MPLQGEGQTPDVNLETFVYGGTNSTGEQRPISTLTFDDLLQRTILLPPQENGECKCAKLADHLTDFEVLQIPREDQLHVKMHVQDPEQFEEFSSYNQLMDYREQDTEPEELADGYFKFREIKAHQSHLKPNHPKLQRMYIQPTCRMGN